MSASGEHNCACDCGDCDVSDGSEASYASDSSELPTWRGGGRRMGWSAPAPAPDSELSTSRTVKSIKGVAMRAHIEADVRVRRRCYLGCLTGVTACSWHAQRCCMVMQMHMHWYGSDRCEEMEANPGAYLPFTEDSEDFRVHCARMRKASSVGWYGATASYRRGLQENHSSLPIQMSLSTGSCTRITSPQRSVSSRFDSSGDSV